jgi:hypothetical protein
MRVETVELFGAIHDDAIRMSTWRQFNFRFHTKAICARHERSCDGIPAVEVTNDKETTRARGLAEDDQSVSRGSHTETGTDRTRLSRALGERAQP